MEEIKKEEALESSKKELSVFQERIGKLETQLKAMSASIKKYSLLAHERSKSLYLRIKEKFKREELPQVKKILCYDCCGDIGYMRGYVKYNKSGFFVVEEAEFVDYSIDREPLVIAYLGSAVLNADSVVMWF